VTFFVPGSVSTSATVSAFGLVFSDVEFSNRTKFELFDSGNYRVFGHFVLNEPARGVYSFSDVQANAGERIAPVRMTAGDLIVFGNSNLRGGSDTALLHDFICAEPLAPPRIPEPSSAILLLGRVGVAGFMVHHNTHCRRRRNEQILSPVTFSGKAWWRAGMGDHGSKYARNGRLPARA